MAADVKKPDDYEDKQKDGEKIFQATQRNLHAIHLQCRKIKVILPAA